MLSPSIRLQPSDLVRAKPQHTARGKHPWNHHDRFGNYYRTDTVNGGIRFQGADKPLPPYVVLSMATPEGSKDDWSHGAVGMNDRILLLFQRGDEDSGFTIWETRSLDDGRTWEGAVQNMAFVGGKYPIVEVGHHMETFRAANVSGVMKATWQNVGDVSPGSAISLRDDGGSPLLVEDDSFSISPDPTSPRRWLLSCSILGEGGTSDWRSVDEPPFTFIRVS